MGQCCPQAFWPICGTVPSRRAVHREPSAESFHDAEEGDERYDHLFNDVARQQLYKLQRQVSKPWSRGRGSIMSPLAHAPRSRLSWSGKTLPQWTGPGRPSSGTSFWSKGDGFCFKVRGAPFVNGGPKVESVGCMYDCIGAEIVSSRCKVGDVLGRILDVPPPQSQAGLPEWKPGCPLPRVLCIVAQIPYQCGPKVFGEHPVEDYGCSVIATFHIKGETLQALEQKDGMPASVRMFCNFVQGGRTDLPMPKGGTLTSGLLKAIAVAGNLEDISIPSYMLTTIRRYNGKPCLITKSGSVRTGDHGEWMEIDIDVRRFSVLARSMLVTLRDLLPSASVHCGFTIQSCEEAELPEGIICDMWLHHIDLMATPSLIFDPREEKS